jgi:glycine cleavage system regulatory protein
MRKTLVLTILGDDKPGIVERLSYEVLSAGGNWEESRMARLAGKFAGLLRVTVDAAGADALEAGLSALEREGLSVVIEPSAEGSGPATVLLLQLVGNDRPGIVRDISRLLAARHVNIEELETEVTSAPMSGEPIFRARALLRVPSTTTPDALAAALEALAGELMVDLTVQRPG